MHTGVSCNPRRTIVFVTMRGDRKWKKKKSRVLTTFFFVNPPILYSFILYSTAPETIFNNAEYETKKM